MSNQLTQFDPGNEAREGNLLRSAIVDSLTHELRTPLTSIKACVTVLLTNSRLEPSQRNDLLTVIDEEADRLNHLVGEAVESAQLDAGVKLDLKPHAIEEIIEAARKECKTLLCQRSISLQLRPGLPAVRADLRLAKKALMQLLENATKYSPAHEPINITAELNGKFVMTSVVDRCGGIDDSETLIFEKFYRGQHHRYRVEGTGMGLHIASAIIKAHGGSLCVTSRPGHGCIFSFTLPIDQQHEQQALSPKADGATAV
jgi:two-component system sensor histidine kinase KdpD